jgi:hypothetical protein
MANRASHTNGDLFDPGKCVYIDQNSAVVVAAFAASAAGVLVAAITAT